MIEFLLGLTWIGWTIIGFVTVALFAMVANDEWGWATFSVIVSAVVAYFFFPAFALLLADPWPLIKYGLLYVAIGVIWSFVKWFFFVLKQKEKYQDAIQAGASRKPVFVPTVTDFIPLASDNKGRIIGWMAYWPWSSIWTIINDPLKRFYEMLVRIFGDAYDRISRKMFGV